MIAFDCYDESVVTPKQIADGLVVLEATSIPQPDCQLQFAPINSSCIQ